MCKHMHIARVRAHPCDALAADLRHAQHIHMCMLHVHVLCTQNFGMVFSIPALVLIGMKLLAQFLLSLQTWWAQYKLQKGANAVVSESRRQVTPTPTPTPTGTRTRTRTRTGTLTGSAAATLQVRLT